MLQATLFRQITLSLWKLIYDTNRNVTTIRKLKNKVFKNIDQEEKDRLADEWKIAKIDERLNAQETIVTELRHEIYAHLNATKWSVQQADHSTTAERRIPFVVLNQLEDTLQAAADALNLLALGTTVATLDRSYEAAGAILSETSEADIDLVLKDIVKNNTAIRIPEENPRRFQYYWRRLSSDHKETYRTYRRWLNLPEISAELDES